MKMKRNFKVFSAVLLAGSLSACSNNLATDVEKLKTDQRDLRTLQAQHTSEMSTLQAQIRELSGRIEQLEFQQGQKISGDLNSLRQDLSYLKQRVPPPAIVPSMALDADEAYAAPLTFEGSASLAEALSFIRSGSYREALTLLDHVLALTAGRKEGGYALFWKGVCFEGLNDARQAVASYGELTIGMQGDHPRKPLALLRQGSVFIRMGDKTAAQAAFSKLISDYPKSTEAAQARERMRDL